MPNKFITSKPYTFSEYLSKLGKYSFLIGVLAKREFKIKYNRTILGVGWFFFQPIVVVVIYTLFFNKFIKIDTGDVPYPAFVFSGLVLWYIFTGVVSKGSYSLVESADLINKVSFPKIIVLIAKTIPVLLECLLLFVFLFLVLFYTHQAITWCSLTALFYFLQMAFLSFALGLLASIVVIRFRDVAHLIPFVMNFGIWLTPVFYPVSIVPDQYQYYLRYLNPLVLPMEGLRNAVFADKGISLESLISFGLTLVFLVFSCFYFVKFEKKIVENL